MTLEPLHPRMFDTTSPVTAYWLTRCDGFRVVGGRKPAKVERSVFDDDPRRPVALRVLREPHGTTALIPVEMVEGVDPIQRVLYVRRPASAASRAATHVTALGPHGRRAAHRTGLSLAAGWKFTSPRLATAVRAAAAAARRRWPSVRRGLAAFGRGALQVAQMFVVLVIWGVVVCAGLVRLGFLAARSLVPRGARLAGGSVAFARRTLR
jgi:hypothetical protein